MSIFLIYLHQYNFLIDHNLFFIDIKHPLLNLGSFFSQSVVI